MCGISGIVDIRERRPVNQDLVQAMNDTLVHRGPDGEGFHFEPGVGFGHRRLSIIDLEGGKQPLYNEDETVVVTYNGEIYNFRSLRRELEELGQVALEAWLERFPEFSLADPEAVTWSGGQVRGPRTLPVRIG